MERRKREKIGYSIEAVGRERLRVRSRNKKYSSTG